MSSSMYWSILSKYLSSYSVEIINQWITEKLFLKIAFRLFYEQFSTFLARNTNSQVLGVLAYTT